MLSIFLRSSPPWKLFIAVISVAAIVLAFFANQTRLLGKANQQLAQQNEQLQKQPSDANPLQLLQNENQRFRADLREIAQLHTNLAQLKQELEPSPDTSNGWQEESNRLQTAISQCRNEIQAINQWMADRDRSKMLDAAQKRWAEKAAVPGFDAARESERLANLLQRVAIGIQKLLSIQAAQRANVDPTKSREQYAEEIRNALAELNELNRPLGDDQFLFENQYIRPESYNDPKKPAIRSIGPDPRGLNLTVYLDGSIEWSPAH
jgi:hypothetical protein